jgi:hypothetical protein
MSEESNKQSRREFVIEQLRRVERDQYDPRSVEGCLGAIRPVFEQLQAGEMLGVQVEKLVRAGNADRAIKLVQVAPFRSRTVTLALALVGVLVAAGVAVAMFLIAGR